MDVEYSSAASSVAAALLASSASWNKLASLPTVFTSADAAPAAVRPSEHGGAKGNHKGGAKQRLGLGASAPRAGADAAGKPQPDGVLGKRLSRDATRKQRKVYEEANAAKRVVDLPSDDDDVSRYDAVQAKVAPAKHTPHSKKIRGGSHA